MHFRGTFPGKDGLINRVRAGVGVINYRGGRGFNLVRLQATASLSPPTGPFPCALEGDTKDDASPSRNRRGTRARIDNSCERFPVRRSRHIILIAERVRESLCGVYTSHIHLSASSARDR